MKQNPWAGCATHSEGLTYEAGGVGWIDAVTAVCAVAVRDLIIRVGDGRSHVHLIKLPLEAGTCDCIHLSLARMESHRTERGLVSTEDLQLQANPWGVPGTW